MSFKWDDQISHRSTIGSKILKISQKIWEEMMRIKRSRLLHDIIQVLSFIIHLLSILIDYSCHLFIIEERNAMNTLSTTSFLQTPPVYRQFIPPSHQFSVTLPPLACGRLSVCLRDFMKLVGVDVFVVLRGLGVRMRYGLFLLTFCSLLSFISISSFL